MPTAAEAPDLLTTLADHDRWTDGLVPTVAAARTDKQARMASAPFPFLRATYARWAQRVTVVAPDPPGPVVLAVGDLHVENFGLWRDAESRLVWGVNDFDEADHLPAAYDLVRLATSALLADEADGHDGTSAGDTLDDLLSGYARAIRTGGGPAVLERPDPPPVDALVPPEHAARWWEAIAALPPVYRVPARARELLVGSLPGGADAPDLCSRTAGMGSRDHLRIVAVARLPGGPTVREVKALTPPATRWLAGDDAEPEIPGAQLLAADPRRSPDPVLTYTGAWVVRRLAPWSDRIELADQHRRTDASALLRAMGAEIANLHLATADATSLAELTTHRSRTWFDCATSRMLDDTRTDWQTWHHYWHHAHGSSS